MLQTSASKHAYRAIGQNGSKKGNRGMKTPNMPQLFLKGIADASMASEHHGVKGMDGNQGE